MKTKWFRRILAGVVSAVLCCGMLTGCGREIEQTNAELNLYVSENCYEYLSYPLLVYQQTYPEIKVNTTVIREADEETYYDSLSGSLMTGKDIPDLLLIDRTFMAYCDICKMEQSGAFIDLNTRLSEDSEYNAADYYSTVIERMKYGDKQYLFPLSFTLPYVASSKERLEQLGITTEEFQSLTVLDFLKLIGEKKEEYGLSVDEIVSGNLTTELCFEGAADAEYYGAYFASLYCPEIVDYEARSYQLPKEEMQSLFESMTVLSESTTDRWGCDGCMYFAPVRNLVRLEVYFGFENDDETPVLTCLRDKNGEINANVWLSAAIPVLSPNQQNAYDFLKVLLSERVQNYKSDKTIPIQYVTIQSPVRKGSLGASSNGPSADKMYDVIRDADKAYRESISNVFLNSECAKIIQGEYQAYASGNSSAADAVEAAEKKLKIYVSE